MRFSAVSAAFLVLAFAAFSGCSDDTTSPDAPGYALAVVALEAAAFDAGSTDGLLYATDDQGRVLGLTAFTTPDTVTLYGQMGPPSTVHITLAVTTYGSVTLVTTLDHAVGDTVRYESREWGHLDHGADLVFENVPDHTEYRLSTPGWTEQDAVLPATTRIRFKNDPGDCFVRIDPIGAQPRGGFISSVRDGDVVSVNLADDPRFHDLCHCPVRFPAGAGWFSASVAAYPDEASFLSRLPMAIDQVSGDENVPAQIDLYAPRTGFHRLATVLWYRNHAGTGIRHLLELGGPPPEAMELMDGAFLVTESPGQSTFSDVDSGWSEFRMTWRSQGGAFGAWQLTGKAPRTRVVLPPVPREVTERFPGCLRENYRLSQAKVGRTRSEDGARLWLVRSTGFLAEE